MIPAATNYVLADSGDAGHSIRRIQRWIRFLGWLGLVMSVLMSVAIIVIAIAGDGSARFFSLLMLPFIAVGVVPCYFMTTTARAFGTLPAKASLAQFATPFGELRRLFFWMLGTIVASFALALVAVVGGVFVGGLMALGAKSAQQDENLERMRAVAVALDEFAKEHGTFPKTLGEIESASVTATDAWERPYTYETKSNGRVIDVYSLTCYGANGTQDDAIPRIQGAKPPKARDLDTQIACGVFTVAPDQALLGKKAVP